MKIKATDLVDAIVAMEKAREVIMLGPVFPGWLKLAGDLTLSQNRFKESLADVSAEVEAVHA